MLAYYIYIDIYSSLAISTCGTFHRSFFLFKTKDNVILSFILEKTTSKGLSILAYHERALPICTIRGTTNDVRR